MTMVHRNPTIGLALGGGGARGLAHIGVLKVFAKENVSIRCLSGTSMGGMIAAAFAAGVPLDHLTQEAQRIGNLTRLVGFIDRRFQPFRGVFTNSGIQKYLAQLLGDYRTFEALPVPIALTAVDNYTGREVVLQSGDLLAALNATMALPGVLEPVRLGGMLLSDGGTLNNVPADLVRTMQVEKVIAVNVSPTVRDMFMENRFIPQAAAAVWRANNIANAAITEAKLRKACPDLIITPDIDPKITTLTGFKYAREVIAAGERAAQRVLPQIMQMAEACPMPEARPLQRCFAFDI